MGTTYILILGQPIYMRDKMENSLICPNQLRTNGITLDDCPKHLAPPDKPSTHSIYLPDEDMYLPLTLQGVTSSFTIRTPTVEEIETCKWITLSNEHEWDLHSTHFQEQEDNYHTIQQGYHRSGGRYIYATTSQPYKNKGYERYNTLCEQISTAFNDQYIISASNTSKRSSDNAAESLAQSLGIGLETAKNTLKVTTQKGIRNTLYPIKRHFRTKQAQLR
jgi:hypothetical protein